VTGIFSASVVTRGLRERSRRGCAPSGTERLI
jgi:hypothetical protein